MMQTPYQSSNQDGRLCWPTESNLDLGCPPLKNRCHHLPWQGTYHRGRRRTAASSGDVPKMLQGSLEQASETPKSIASTGCLRLCPLGGAGGKAIFAKDAFPDMISEAFTTWVEYSVTSKNAEPITNGITCRGIEISIERSLVRYI